jgi:hypothetical protein
LKIGTKQKYTTTESAGMKKITSHLIGNVFRKKPSLPGHMTLKHFFGIK